jgi:hypothetical protein
MNVGSTFVTNGETAKPGDPGERPLDDPSVFSEMGAALDTFSGDTMHDAAVAAGTATARVIVSFVGMEFSRTATWAPPLPTKRWNGVKEWLEHSAVMNIGATQQDGKWNTLSIRDDVPFCARAPAVRRAWPCRFTPLFAATDALSMQARLQSSRSA